MDLFKICSRHCLHTTLETINFPCRLHWRWPTLAPDQHLCNCSSRLLYWWLTACSVDNTCLRWNWARKFFVNCTFFEMHFSSRIQWRKNADCVLGGKWIREMAIRFATKCCRVLRRVCCCGWADNSTWFILKSNFVRILRNKPFLCCHVTLKGEGGARLAEMWFAVSFFR